jgi:hypothetical protein
LWKALKAFFSKTLKKSFETNSPAAAAISKRFQKSQSRCASFWVPQMIVGKKASRTNSLHVDVSIRFFIHHEVVLPEERRINGQKVFLFVYAFVL